MTTSVVLNKNALVRPNMNKTWRPAFRHLEIFRTSQIQES